MTIIQVHILREVSYTQFVNLDIGISKDTYRVYKKQNEEKHCLDIIDTIEKEKRKEYRSSGHYRVFEILKI
jgi:hypothetical protein